jgi:coenzyme F420-reducing hydrogenase delta subunit
LFVDTSGGRKVVTVANYTQRIIDDTHTAVIALADQIPLFAGVKRSLKASARSLSWLQELRKSKEIDWNETFLFGVTGSFAHNQYSLTPVSSIPATDTTIDAHMVANAVELLQQGCDGLVVGGAGMGESLYQLGIALRSVKHAADSTLSTVVSNAVITTTTSSSDEGILNKNHEEETKIMTEEIRNERRKVLVMVQEMNSIKEILLAAENGIDFIGTNLPEILSSSGLALTWILNANSRSSFISSSNVENKLDQNLAAAVEEEEIETLSRKRTISNLSSLDFKTNHAFARTGTTTTIISTILTAHEVINDVEKSNTDLNSDSIVHEKKENKENNHATPDDYIYALSSGGT